MNNSLYVLVTVMQYDFSIFLFRRILKAFKVLLAVTIVTLTQFELVPDNRLLQFYRILWTLSSSFYQNLFQSELLKYATLTVNWLHSPSS